MLRINGGPMMFYIFPFLFAGAALAMSTPVVATQGNYAAALRTILTKTAAGT